MNQLGLGFVFTARDLASGAIGKLKNSFLSMEGATSAAALRVIKSFKLFAVGLALFTAGILGLRALGPAIQSAREFGKSIGEVSTLVDEAVFPTRQLKDISLDLAATFGGAPTEQAAALYQTISAGASSAAQATDLLTVANKLAIGGVTDLLTAVDALTTATNAYAGSNLTAADASDVLFVAVRAGKTTAGELGLTLGRVAPLAANLGIEFDELLAAISAVTTQGIRTNEAVTGLKAALSGILKPTSKSAEEAKRLGIQFDAAALKAKGLDGLIKSVTESAGFNSESFSKLIGPIEGVNAFLALTANNSAKFNDILVQMTSRAGSTETALGKMTAQLDFQERRFMALRETSRILIGEALVPIRVAVLKVANAILVGFGKIPRPLIAFATLLFAAASALSVLIGGTIAIVVAVKLLIAGAAALGISLGLVAAAVLPVIAAFALLAAGIVLLFFAFKANLGGIADLATEVFAKIKLFVDATAQLFKTGKISGPLVEEFKKAENQGILKFAGAVFAIFFRVQRFIGGFVAGVKNALEAFGPVFAELVSSLRALGRAFTGVGTEATDAIVGIPSDEFVKFGKIIGGVIIGLIAFVTRFVTETVRAITFLIRLRNAFLDFRDRLKSLFDKIVRIVTAPVRIVRAQLIRMIPVDIMVKALLRLGKIIAGFVSGFRKLLSPILSVIDRAGGLLARLPGAAEAVAAPIVRGGEVVALPAARIAGVAAPAVAQAAGFAAGVGGGAAAGLEALTVQVPLFIDGEQVAEATANARRTEGAREFRVVGAEPGQ